MTLFKVMTKDKTIRLVDQDAINIVLQDYIIPLPYKYNTRFNLHKQPKSKLGIITHHIGSCGRYEKEYMNDKYILYWNWRYNIGDVASNYLFESMYDKSKLDGI